MNLASTIKNILGLPEETGGKEVLIKNMIEDYRKDYPLLEKVIQKETTFEETYKSLIKKHEGFKTIFPKWVNKHEAEMAKENEGLVDAHGNEDNSRVVAGYIIGCGCIGLVSLIGVTMIFPEWFPNPPSITEGLISGGLLALVSVYPTIMTAKNRKALKKDLKLLDEQINKLYIKNENY